MENEKTKWVKAESILSTARLMTEEQLRIEKLEERVAQLEENMKKIAYCLGYRPENEQEKHQTKVAVPLNKINEINTIIFDNEVQSGD